MTRKSHILFIVFMVLVGTFFGQACAEAGLEPVTRGARQRKDKHIFTKEFLSPVYHIDKIYKSMEGPAGSVKVKLQDDGPPELLWITGYRTVVVGEDGETPVDQQFMCHNNLDYNVPAHAKLFGWNKAISPRMFTLSQGQFWVEFPDGFGFPVMSNEEFNFTSQVLNHNLQDIDIKVRHKVYIDYIRDQDLEKPLKPLFNTSAFIMALIEGEEGVFQVQEPSEVQKQATCLPGLHAPQAGRASIYPDQFGKKFSGHWVVPPGKEERRTLVTRYMNIPFDTTVHFIALHLHPFAESLELRDLTTGETIFKSYAKAPDGMIGLADVDYFSSDEGVEVYKDHEYALISVYDNDSGVNQDAMATMFMYLHDKEFKKPAILEKASN